MSAEPFFSAAPSPPTPGAAEVAAALGRPLHAEDPEGWEVALSAGAQAEGAIAWVERRSRERGASEEVAYTLHASRGEATRTWRLECYNPYFGCTVELIRWVDDAVALVYREKHTTLLARVPLAGPPRLLDVGGSWRAWGDVLFARAAVPGLARSAGIVDATWRTPLPLSALAAAEARGEPAPPLARLAPPPADPARFWAALRERVLPGAPALEADLLLGSQCYPFCRPGRPATTSYDASPPEPLSPHELPRGWEAALDSRQQPRFRALLERAAAAARGPLPQDLTGEALALEAAALQLAERATALLAPPGPGADPEAFWRPWSVARFAALLRAEPGTFPPGFHEAFARLRSGR